MASDEQTRTAPRTAASPAPRDERLEALLRRWRDAALDGDASVLADLTDETTALLGDADTPPASEPPRVWTCLNCGGAMADGASHKASGEWACPPAIDHTEDESPGSPIPVHAGIDCDGRDRKDWPHLHLNTDDERVTLTINRWYQDSHLAMSEDYFCRYMRREVGPPNRLARLLGDTLEARVRRETIRLAATYLRQAAREAEAHSIARRGES